MTDTGAYPTAILYPTTYQSKIAPTHLATACMMQGVAGPAIDRPYRYCELGSGMGFTPNLLAAANPFASFDAVDFNAAHVAQARAFATAGGLANIRHHALDFASAVEADLGEFDIIAIHGVWTWVGPQAQADLLRFIDRRLKPGGLAFLSYTALPGMNAVASLRQMIEEVGLLSGEETADKVKRVVAFLNELRDANPWFADRFPGLMRYIHDVGELNDASALHDILAPHWSAVSHRSVREALASVGCDFVGDCDLVFNRAHLAFPAPAATQIAGLSGLPAESLKDFLSQRTFRRDLYRRPVPGEQARRPLLRFVLREPVDPAKPLRLPGGTLPTDPALLEWLMAALHAPVEPSALAGHPALQRFDRRAVESHFLALIALGKVAAAVESEARPMPARPTLGAFNRAALDQPIVPDDARILAGPTIGAGVVLDRSTAYLLWAVTEGGDPAERLAARLAAEGRSLKVAGETAAGDVAATARPMVDQFRARDLPRLARLGVVA